VSTEAQHAPTRRARAELPLKRTLGTTSIVFMVIAGAAPLTVVAGIVPLILLVGNGIGAPADYLFAGAILILFAVGFTTMSHHIKNGGAFYAYIQKGLGRVGGLSAAALALVTYLLLLVAVFAYFGEASSNVVQTFTGADVPWWLFTAGGLLLIAFLGHRNVEMSARVLGILLVAELAIVAIVDFAIIFSGGDNGLRADPFFPENVFSANLGTGVMFAIFGFIGFEATAAFRSEAKDPDRTIPRATYIAVSIIALFYAFSSWAAIVGLGVDKAVDAATADPVNLITDLGTRYAGAFVHDAMQVLLATSFFACVLTFHNVVSRYLFTLGRFGALPQSIAAVHPKYSSPYRASAITAAFTGVLLLVFTLPGLDPVVEIYTWLSGAATLGLIVLMAATSLAVLVFFGRQGRLGFSVWRTRVAPALALAGLLTALVLVLANFEFLIGSAWLAGVFVVVLALAIAGGAAWALTLRARRPDVYAQLTEEEDAAA
jgi:amino acid transporter